MSSSFQADRAIFPPAVSDAENLSVAERDARSLRYDQKETIFAKVLSYLPAHRVKYFPEPRAL
jgi:hypothetical protein